MKIGGTEINPAVFNEDVYKHNDDVYINVHYDNFIIQI